MSASPDNALESVEEEVTTSIEHYLLSLGHSLHRAQEALTRLSTTVEDGDGRVVYQIPRLDFEFKMTAELRPGEGGGRLHLRPAAGHGGEAGVASAIKGSLVAVPIRAGRGLPVLRLQASRNKDRMMVVTALLSDPHGAALANIPVSFDVASAVDGGPITGVRFQDGRKSTTAQGRAINTVLVDATVGAGIAVMVRVEAQGQIGRLHFVVGGSEE